MNSQLAENCSEPSAEIPVTARGSKTEMRSYSPPEAMAPHCRRNFGLGLGSKMSAKLDVREHSKQGLFPNSRFKFHNPPRFNAPVLTANTNT